MFDDSRDGYGEILKHLPVTAGAYRLPDKKTRSLIKLGVAIGLGSEDMVKSRARQALAEGVTAPEIYLAALEALTTAGFPATVDAMTWVDEVVGSHEMEAARR